MLVRPICKKCRRGARATFLQRSKQLQGSEIPLRLGQEPEQNAWPELRCEQVNAPFTRPLLRLLTAESGTGRAAASGAKMGVYFIADRSGVS